MPRNQREYEDRQHEKGLMQVKLWVPEYLAGWFWEHAQFARDLHDASGDARTTPPFKPKRRRTAP
jgi:hypothetical protein